MINKCDYCKNKCGGHSSCKNYDRIAGREKIIKALEDLGYKHHCKILNVVKASEIVLFKDLARFYNVPNTLANSVTTNEELSELLSEHTPVDELMKAITKYIPNANKVFAPMIDDIEPYVYGYSGMVYGQSIHASGTLLSEEPIQMAISEDTACANGHYCEELGYIKYDLLSLSNLDSIEEIQGMDIDWNNVSEDTIKYICEGSMDFVFQFGSPVVDNMIHGITQKELMGLDLLTSDDETERKELIKRTSVRKLAEITSINRPGALSANLNVTWVETENFSEESENYNLETNVTEQLNRLRKSNRIKI